MNILLTGWMASVKLFDLDGMYVDRILKDMVRVEEPAAGLVRIRIQKLGPVEWGVTEYISMVRLNIMDDMIRWKIELFSLSLPKI